MPVITLPLGVLLDDLVHEKCVANEAPCEIPFYSLYVKYDGRVSVCCADFTDILDVGNIHQQHLGEIITGERLREFRIKHLQRNFSEIPICKSCGNRTCVDLTPIASELMSFI
jgi:radical SAM protein with 4Fe4S-binding SPASM domain